MSLSEMPWVASGTLSATGGVVAALIWRAICGIHLQTARPWRKVATVLSRRSGAGQRPTVVNVAEYRAALTSLGLVTQATEAQLTERMRRGDHAERGIGAWLALSMAVPMVPWMVGAFVLSTAEDWWLTLHVGLAGLGFVTTGMLHKAHIATFVARGLEAPLLLSRDIGIAVLRCKAVADGHGDQLHLDGGVGVVIGDLRSFSKHGYRSADLKRRAELIDHTERVCGALHDSAGRVLVDGAEAAPNLARLLHTIAERAAQGRWLGLLDEADLPESLPLEPSGTRRRRITEAAVVLLLAAGAAAAVIGAMALQVPAQYAAVVGLAAFLGGGLAWRGSRVGVTSRSMFSTIGAAFAQQQDQQPPPGGPTQPPTPEAERPRDE
ncbi:hypothetical protein DY218_13230 [Streptomyces triticagri]|uniref:Uncharacterized protein n=1 Tax=Streptomyces triticagri TaxID=2293568 RepID=A0A372M5N0_9ACTN|nr:hypothetical protein [Streptomyces triticagri]RFU86252.1 hypothetical protein DY218_13230 [Streptomyces triticagri]